MKKGMVFGLSHREKRVIKINLLHFPVFTSKNFVISKLPEPSTDFVAILSRTLGHIQLMRLQYFLTLSSKFNSL